MKSPAPESCQVSLIKHAALKLAVPDEILLCLEFGHREITMSSVVAFKSCRWNILGLYLLYNLLYIQIHITSIRL